MPVRARDLLAEVDDLHSMFASDRVALRGRLRIDLPTEVARTTIMPALPDFHGDLTRVGAGIVEYGSAKSILFKRGSTVYCGLDQ